MTASHPFKLWLVLLAMNSRITGWGSTLLVYIERSSCTVESCCSDIHVLIERSVTRTKAIPVYSQNTCTFDNVAYQLF